MIPCDICERFGHPWYACPDRGKKPVGWKPERLRKGRPAARGSSSKPVIVREVGTPDSNKSTAARKDVPVSAELDNSTVRVGDSVLGSTPSLSAPKSQPGTQVPAVDTILTTAEAAAAHLAPKHPGGRPKKHEDRNAYRAKKAKEYRERDRAAKAQQEGK